MSVVIRGESRQDIMIDLKLMGHYIEETTIVKGEIRTKDILKSDKEAQPSYHGQRDDWQVVSLTSRVLKEGQINRPIILP